MHAECDAQSEVLIQLESLLSTQGFLKRVVSSKSTAVRTAAYTLMAHSCYRYTSCIFVMNMHMQMILWNTYIDPPTARLRKWPGPMVAA